MAKHIFGFPLIQGVVSFRNIIQLHRVAITKSIVLIFLYIEESKLLLDSFDMAYSKKDLNNYIQKLQEVLSDKNQNYLEEEDFEAAAQALGIAPEDIKQAREDFLYRGEQHLKHQNWTEAQKEFDQLLLLDPRNPQAYLGLAKINYQLWTSEGDRTYKEKTKEYAEKTLNLNPKHQEAYDLIRKLKQKKKKAPYSPKKSGARKNWSKSTRGKMPVNNLQMAIIILTFILVVTGIILSQNFGEWGKLSSTSKFNRIIDFALVQGKKAPVLWLSNRDYYGQPTNFYIIDPQKKEILKEFSVERTMNNFHPLGDAIYIKFQKGDFEGRDLYTGEIVDNSEILARHFSEFEQGIGQASIQGSFYLIELVLKKDATKFYYNPLSKSIMKEEDYKKIQREVRYVTELPYPASLQNYKTEEVYLWRREGGSKDKKHFTLYRKRVPSIMKGNDRLGWEFKAVSPPSAQYLRTLELFSNENYCVIRHRSEIGEDGEYILSVLDKNAKAVLELKAGDLEDPHFKTLMEKPAADNVLIYEGQLWIGREQFRFSQTDKSFPLIMAIDLKTKKILWKYSPGKELE